MIIKSFVRNYNIIRDYPRTNMVLFRITENEPSKMHNVRPYVYSRPWCILIRNVYPYSKRILLFDNCILIR